MTLPLPATSTIASEGVLAVPAAHRALPRMLQTRRGVVALVLAIVIVASALFAPLLAPYDPAVQDLARKLEPPNREHLLGTDQFGRDVLSRILFGGRISLLTGIGSVTIGATIGVLIGLLAAYRGGWPEMMAMAGIDVLLGFRTYLLAIMVVAILGPSTLNMLLAIGIAMFPEIARITRAETLSVKNRDFVTAARSGGASHLRILMRHVTPQVIAPLVVVATFNIANAIIVEASLSFLGLGPAPPTPAWGLMISEGRRFILGDAWLPAIPGVAIMLTVLAFNMLGDTLRDLQDPRLRRR
jgi:ABC-type dipeptide/oligopeptide/nickel transport system permease subunit